MLCTGHNRKSSVEKNTGRGSQGAWRQDELIFSKPPVVKLLWLYLWLCSESECSAVLECQPASNGSWRIAIAKIRYEETSGENIAEE
jgi:hypothetical protein